MADQRLEAEAREIVTAFSGEYAGCPDAEAIADLGCLLRWLDDLAVTQAAYQQAAAFGDHELSASALMTLAHVLHRQGDIRGARSAYLDLIRLRQGRWPRRAASALRKLPALPPP